MKLGFITANKKIIRFEIDGTIIRYFDDIWKDGIQIMPQDQNVVEKLRRSGKQTLRQMARLIIESNSGANKREYEKCRTEEQLADMIRRDCEIKGLMEIN